MREGDYIINAWEHVEQTEAKAELAKVIDQVRSFDDLEHILDNLGVIEGDAGARYSADDLILQINDVRKGVSSLNSITRAYGLRDQVRMLYGAELVTEASTLEEIEKKLVLLRAVNNGQLLNSDGTDMDIQEFIQVFRRVVLGEVMPNMLTRQYGLRAKAEAMQEQYAAST